MQFAHCAKRELCCAVLARTARARLRRARVKMRRGRASPRRSSDHKYHRMSRHELRPLVEGGTVTRGIVGWDRPLQTFFAQLFSINEENE